MKTRHFIALGVIVLVMGTFFAGCSLLGTSIDTRIGDFVSSLNGDRTQTYLDLVPNSTIYNANNGVTGLWDTHFPTADGTYSSTITSTQPFDPVAGVDVDITPSATGLTKHWRFFLQNTGSMFEDWFISDIQLSNGTTYTTIF